jgi:hypothetical protein
MSEVKSKPIVISVDAEMRSYLKQAAKEDLRSINNYVLILIKKDMESKKTNVNAPDIFTPVQIPEITEIVNPSRSGTSRLNSTDFKEFMKHVDTQYVDFGEPCSEGVNDLIKFEAVPYMDSDKGDDYESMYADREMDFFESFIPERPVSIRQVDFKFNESDRNVYVLTPLGFRRLKHGDAGFDKNLDWPIYNDGYTMMYIHKGMDRFVKMSVHDLVRLPEYVLDDIVSEYGVV